MFFDSRSSLSKSYEWKVGCYIHNVSLQARCSVHDFCTFAYAQLLRCAPHEVKQKASQLLTAFGGSVMGIVRVPMGSPYGGVDLIYYRCGEKIASLVWIVTDRFTGVELNSWELICLVHECPKELPEEYLNKSVRECPRELLFGKCPLAWSIQVDNPIAADRLVETHFGDLVVHRDWP